MSADFEKEVRAIDYTSAVTKINGKHNKYVDGLPHLCTENETMAPLHVATVAVKGELCT